MSVSAAELEAIVVAVDAVVARDVERVRSTMYEPYRDAVDTFWDEPDTYDDGSPIELVRPPGEPSSWNVEATRRDDGSLAVEVPMWSSGGETDLSLVLDVLPDSDGGVRPEISSLHVL